MAKTKARQDGMTKLLAETEKLVDALVAENKQLKGELTKVGRDLEKALAAWTKHKKGSAQKR